MPEKILLRRLTIVFSLLAAASSVIGIFSVYFCIALISSMFQGSRTIALSAALIWIFLGSVLAYQAVSPLQRITRLAVQAVLVLIAAIEAIEFIFSIQGSHFFIETLFVRAGTILLGPLSSPISPVAAALAVPAAIALAFVIRDPVPSAKSMRIPDAISILGFAISIVSITFILSYTYGNPLLYGTQFIPIAFISALAAFFTGAALVAAAGPRAVPSGT